MNETQDDQVRQTAFGMEGPLFEQVSLPPDPNQVKSPHRTGLYLAAIGGVVVLVGGVLLMLVLPKTPPVAREEPTVIEPTTTPAGPVTLQDRIDDLDQELKTYEQSFDSLVFPPVEPEIRLDPKKI